MAVRSTSLLTTILLFLLPSSIYSQSYYNNSTPYNDIDFVELPLNLEYLEAEFFLWGALGHGLDRVAPYLVSGGPPPIGVKKANLDKFTRDIVLQFAFQEVGHLRAIRRLVPGFPRPQLDLSVGSFAKVMDAAVGHALTPPFDPYANGLNFLLASYIISYVGLTGYVGANDKLKYTVSKRVRMLVAGLLSVESAQDAIIRALLYEWAAVTVQPYGITVADFTVRISELRNQLGNSGRKDEGIVIPPLRGARGESSGNVVVGDDNALAFARTPKEVLRIIYGDGDERVPGGFYPKGASGRIAQSYLEASST
ncbi:hypothetical protein IFM89_034073 [Coptis chinensis]|uniref:Desiccation-related protein PCC13-62 n=1 Tax=Coptis chinensis TaxID=261450 RepID=A0A835M7R4_9MAGN|nr:hypothetical protein IFM89_034073 [Coptis chinensis]